MAKIQFEITKKTLMKVAVLSGMDLTDELVERLTDADVSVTEEEVNQMSGEEEVSMGLAAIVLVKLKIWMCG